MSLIIDELSLAYRFIAPHPFNEGLFLKKIENVFEHASDIITMDMDSGNFVPKPSPLYIAKDADVELKFNPEKGIVGVKGNDFKEVNEKFNLIKSTIGNEMKIDFKTDITYLELIGRGRYKAKILPLITLNNHFPPSEKPFKDFFNNKDIATLEIRVCDKENIENKRNIRELDDWFDIRISPLILNPNFYSWSVVYRKSNIEEVENFWSELEEKITKLFIDIEKGED